MSVEFLKRLDAPSLAYQRTNGENKTLPTVLFLHGLWSDMEGSKAQFLSASCAAKGQTFVRFDCRGHGKSHGSFEDATIGDWLKDALDIIDNVTTGPLILVGSSMGGWLSLLACVARSERMHGLLGLAAAPDFTRGIREKMDMGQREELSRSGLFYLSGRDTDFPCIITQKLLDEGEEYCILSTPINITCPVRLMQGMKDDSVPWQTAHRIANAIKGTDKETYLRADGDHRLSSPEDLALLEKLVNGLSEK